MLQYHCTAAPVLRGVSLCVAPGRKVALVGRTGAGKSSVLGALLRLYPFHGTVRIGGVDVAGLSRQRLRRSVRVVLQDAALLAGTVRSNLWVSAGEDDAYVCGLGVTGILE